MKSVFLVVVMLLSQEGQAQWKGSPHFIDSLRAPAVGAPFVGAPGAAVIGDAGESAEPQMQNDESAKPFRPGWGERPKNAGSIFVPGLQIKKPQWGGSGCPEGTVGVSLTPDQKTLALLFDNYVVQAGRSYGNRRDLKSCTVQVPLELPRGVQFTVVKLDYRGYNLIPRNARVRYFTLYSFVDSQTGKQAGRRVRRHFDFRGPLDDEYTLSTDISTEPVWSPCGRSGQLRIETRAAAVTNAQGEDVMGTVDSLDAAIGASPNGEMQYHLLWRQCR